MDFQTKDPQAFFTNKTEAVNYVISQKRYLPNFSGQLLFVTCEFQDGSQKTFVYRPKRLLLPNQFIKSLYLASENAELLEFFRELKDAGAKKMIAFTDVTRVPSEKLADYINEAYMAWIRSTEKMYGIELWDFIFIEKILGKREVSTNEELLQKYFPDQVF